MKLFLSLLILLLFSNTYLQSQSLKLGWSRTSSYGYIWDMKAIPNQEQFLSLSDHEVQLRNMDTGDSVANYKIGTTYCHDMEIVNGKLFIAGKKLIKYDLQTMDSLGEFSFQDDNPSPGLYTTFNFVDVAVHPSLPLAYVIRERNAFLSGGCKNVSYFIDVINTDEMKPVGQLTFASDTLIKWYKIDISKDGKYLAAIQKYDPNMVVKVWSTETNKVVSEFKNYLPKPYYQNGIDLHFAEKNNLLYLSGDFVIRKNGGGLIAYDLINNTIVDSSLTYPNLYIGAGEFAVNEQNNTCYMATSGNAELYYMSLSKKSILFTVDALKEENRKYQAFNNLIYNKNKTYVIGNSENDLAQILIDTNVTSVSNETQITNINTINNIATINYTCNNQIVNYQIIGVNGQTLTSKEEPNINNQIKINFNIYPNGIYFVNLSCGNISSTFKIIKG
ncbi:MAG: T9SS type A sorting domain-containing protein [Candidatus Kapabacteria bacterium]|nr:T9SS type A sorting domain-containing protein [Candidatus Kapabacteria bacterium]